MLRKMSVESCPSDDRIVLDVTAGPVCATARASALGLCSATYYACEGATLGLNHRGCASTYDRCVTDGWDATERCFVTAWQQAGCLGVKPLPVPSKLLERV